MAETDAKVFKLPGVLAQELAGFLEQEIIYCELKPGARLTEEEVVKRFGVSRSPVREAFRLLESDGLVQRLARRGVSVTRMSRRDLAEVYACRMALEGLAAAEAAKKATPEDLEDLRRVLETMATALANTDIRGYFTANVAFTARIHRAAGNATLMRLLNGIGKQTLRYRFVAYSKAPQLMRVSLPGSEEIVKAIAAHDPVRAREVTERLIEGSWSTIAASIDEEEAEHE